MNKKIDLSQPYYKRIDEDEQYDEARIERVPRWKSSELSGDEWRFSWKLSLYRKGILVWSAGFGGDMHFAATALAYNICTAGERGETTIPNDSSYCMNPGCRNPATVEYRLKSEFSREGFERACESPIHRRFCDQHSTRGDCGLEDADRNHERVELRTANA